MPASRASRFRTASGTRKRAPAGARGLTNIVVACAVSQGRDDGEGEASAVGNKGLPYLPLFLKAPDSHGVPCATGVRLCELLQALLVVFGQVLLVL
jgi:hypothetical protein